MKSLVVHIAVSTSATPTDWTTSWRKYHYCLWRSDQQCSNTNGVGHNETIYVDDDNLYIAFLDDTRTPTSTGNMTTTLMTLDKDDLMGGTQATPQFHNFIEDNTTGYRVWGHAIAVEYDAWNNSDPVYTLASG